MKRVCAKITWRVAPGAVHRIVAEYGLFGGEEVHVDGVRVCKRVCLWYRSEIPIRVGGIAATIVASPCWRGGVFRLHMGERVIAPERIEGILGVLAQ